MDPYAMIWVLNTLADAQKGRPPWPEALQMMSRGYSWLGKWTNGMPTNKAKIFHARALAFAELLGSLSGNASSEKALALTQCGRDKDALFVLARSTPDSQDTSALASALTTRDLQAVEQRLRSNPSRAWRFAFALLTDYHNRTGKSRAAFAGLVKDNPLDLTSLSWLIDIEDVGPNHDLTRQYLDTTLGWEPYLEVVMGRRAPSDLEYVLEYPRSRQPPDSASLIEALSRMPPGDLNQEIPLRARMELAQDFAFDAAIARMIFLRTNMGSRKTPKSCSQGSSPWPALILGASFFPSS